jgi:anti-sigma regulatory factor (Ser/Thr protein kinase)
VGDEQGSLDIDCGVARCRVSAHPAGPRAARRFAATTLDEQGAPTDVSRDLVLVVSELVTNFVEHSNGDDIDVALGFGDPGWWVVTVDGGSTRDGVNVDEAYSWSVSCPEENAGRALAVIPQLVDEISVDAGLYHVRVDCRRRRD